MPNNQKKTVKDIMVKDIISVTADTPLIEATRLFGENHFDGMPVIDSEGKLIGLVTEYDMVNNAFHVHLPTMQKIFENIHIMDGKEIKEDKKKILSIRVKDVMNTEPLTLLYGASLSQVVQAFKEHHRVNPIPVIDENNKLVGIVSRYDLIKLFELSKL